MNDDRKGELQRQPSLDAESSFSVARWMAAAFLLYGLTATGLLAVNIPPFQVPDEPAHFLRAAQLADGWLIGVRYTRLRPDGSSYSVAGGPSDPAIAKTIRAFNPLAFHPEKKATQGAWADSAKWSDAREMRDFSNTAIYPPFFYLPSAIGILTGRMADLSVSQTLVVSRLLTGTTATVISAAAVATAGAAAVWLFAVLALPMSLSLIASVSQDALLIACSALGGAILVRQLRSGSTDGKSLVGAGLLFGLVAMARPPYGALALLLLSANRVSLRWRVLAASVVILACSIWSGLAALTVLTPYGTNMVGSEPATQLARLYVDPALGLQVVWETMKQYSNQYLTEFVGVLGWQDTHLRTSYYTAAELMLVVAAVATTLGIKRPSISGYSFMFIAAGLLTSLFLVVFVQYLNWTPLGHETVLGVYGRYFTPLALAGTCLFPALGNSKTLVIYKMLAIVVMVFPVVSLTVVIRSVVVRYYLG